MVSLLHFRDMHFLNRPSVTRLVCPSVLAVHRPTSVRRISGLVFFPTVHACEAVNCDSLWSRE